MTDPGSALSPLQKSHLNVLRVLCTIISAIVKLKAEGQFAKYFTSKSALLLTGHSAPCHSDVCTKRNLYVDSFILFLSLGWSLQNLISGWVNS